MREKRAHKDTDITHKIPDLSGKKKKAKLISWNIFQIMKKT